MSKKTLVTITIVFITLLFFGILRFLYRPGAQITNGVFETAQQQHSPTTTVNSNTAVQISFDESSISLSPNEKHTSTLSFPVLPTPAPTAFTLILLFNPKHLQVEDVQPGNLWTGENILQKEIDNNIGVIKFSLGQGFSDEVTNNTQIAQITYTALSKQETKISIIDGSAYASFQEKKLIPMQGPPLMISTKQNATD